MVVNIIPAVFTKIETNVFFFFKFNMTTSKRIFWGCFIMQNALWLRHWTLDSIIWHEICCCVQHYVLLHCC